MSTVKVAAAMTAGRYENTLARNCIELATRTLGIPLTVSRGVYYGQCMQRMLEGLCETDCDFIVTIDGDSIFTAKQLQRMVAVIAQETQIDALAALQMRRGVADPLGTAKDGETKVVDGTPIKVETAHFGLTVIRVESLRELPKPWFFAKPNKQGQWDGDKVDDDVWFWLQWAERGNTAYIDPGTRIGHLEEMISAFDENMQPRHYYPSEWGKE
jgi:hypothetical protein